jgi:hypothetical protein
VGLCFLGLAFDSLPGSGSGLSLPSGATGASTYSGRLDARRGVGNRGGFTDASSIQSEGVSDSISSAAGREEGIRAVYSSLSASRFLSITS